MTEREGSQRERGATTVARPEGRGPGDREERALSERRRACLLPARGEATTGLRGRAGVAPLALGLSLVLALLAGCTKPATTASPSPSATGTATQTGSATPTPTPSGAPLPASCSELLPILDLDDALGVPLVGRTAYIKGVAEPKINRLGRVTCRYGLQPLPHNKTSPPRLEVGVSAYTDAESATERVDATVVAARSEGASPREVQVGGKPATALLGPSPLIVFASDTRTVAITFGHLLVRGDPTKPLVAVAELALKNLPQ